MKVTWNRIANACLPTALGLVLLAGGLVRCVGGGYVPDSRTAPPYDDEAYGGNGFDGGDFDENDGGVSDGGDRDAGGENGEGEGAGRD